MNKSNIQKILSIGLGAQASAWCLNLRDSGSEVHVFLRDKSPNFKKAKELGLEIVTEQTVDFNAYDFILLLIPDDSHLDFLKKYEKVMSDLNIIYAHGFSLHYQAIQDLYPRHNHILLAPKAIASEVRFNYETKSPLAAVISFEHMSHNKKETSEKIDILLKSLGVTEVLERSFKEETEADLFSEQAILCSLIPFGAKIAFEKMLERGISKELAYIECWHETRLIANAMIDKGPIEFFKLISPNALVGGLKAREKLLDDKYLKSLDVIFDNIQSGQFFHDLKNINFQNERSEVIKELDSHPLTKTYENFGRKIK
ncbi:MAG: hypothetical protein CME69_06850 [Halobacteriovorax sp.]|nr:hypothetical protein [Halobacteriovorax sp.]|tara:strand:+ start:1283 stop:2224 length:942 start_codon:yes stop_codon:yes gene_type:complete